MHIVAATSESNTHASLLTADASLEQVSQLLPRMSPVPGLSAPGPASVATVELTTGHRATVVFHERKSFVEILAPLQRGLERGLADLLAELNVRPEAITWIHDNLDKEVVFASLSAGSAPHSRIR